MPLSNKGVFILSGVAVVAGALMTLDWTQIASPQTAGTVVALLGGAVAVARALLGQK